jgi:uncharacterized protein YjbI with pentapeptide repeats
MRVYKDTVFELSLMPWELEPPRTSAIVVVKGTFRLVDGGPCPIADEQVPVLGEVPWEDGEPPSLRTETDYAVLKPRGEWYLTGHAFTAGAPATVLPVHVRVGALQKQLAVWGDRVWRRGILGATPSDPVPFERMPLRWERSFGGPGQPANPLGRGLAPVQTRGGAVDALPNVELPHHGVQSRDDRPPPAGMFAVPSTWKARLAKTGTYDELWKASRWPYFPRDFDFEFFCCAPPDQRLREGFWRGDEVIELAGLHPERTRLNTRLPGLRARFFVEWARPRPPGGKPLELLSRAELEALGPPEVQEVPLRLDTIVFDTDAQQVICQWRGLFDVADNQLSNVARVFAVHEPLGVEHPNEHYAAWLLRKLCEEADEFAVDAGDADALAAEGSSDEVAVVASEELSEAGVAAAEVELRVVELMATLGELMPKEAEPDPALVREKYREMGLDAAELLPEPEPPAEMPEEGPIALQNAAFIREKLDKSFRDLDLSGAPCCGLDLRDADFSGAILTDACFVGANLTNACFDGAILARADLSGANLSGASLRGADVTEIRAMDANFEGATLDGASGSHAVLTRAVFRGASLVGVELESCELTQADLRDACLDAADLVGSTLDEAGFIGSSLVDTSLEGVLARGANFERCRLHDLRASDGADFTGTSFVLVDAARAQLQGATLTEASFAGSNLEEADLSDARGEGVNLLRCVLRRAKLDRAHLARAILIEANLFEASLQESDLSHADARGACLFSAHLWRARYDGTLFDGADLSLTVLAGGLR